jgi:gentisate 1,2-dioxygenase
MRYPWTEVRDGLQALARAIPDGAPVQLAYVNPETGTECLHTLGFSALMLRPAETLTLPRRSSSAVMHGVEGGGLACVDGTEMHWDETDTFAVPTHAEVKLENGSTSRPAFLFIVDDAPLQRLLGFHEIYRDARFG